LHAVDYALELLEVHALFRTQRVLDEEWDDVPGKMLPAPDSVVGSIAVVGSHHTTTKERLERMEQLHIALVLHDGELRQNLKAGAHLGMRIDPDVEASFTVHEACHPCWIELH